jgi:hypothetical protein
MLRLSGLLYWVLASSAIAQTGVFTYHNDVSRTGQVITETILTPKNVNAEQFGKLFAQPVDGDVYAQPLYVAKLTIPGKGVHNVVFVATEADSLYAFDADSASGPAGGALWHASLLDTSHGASPGATAVHASEVSCGGIVPTVGITSTPVIDPIRATLYVEAFSKENGKLIHRLHALDLTTGAERSGSPVAVAAHLKRRDGTDMVFDPAHQLSRAGLLLSNGMVYVAYGSHCDRPRFQGWMFAYDAMTLVDRGAFVTAAEHGRAAIWMSGAAPAADSKGNVFVTTGDGRFDMARAVPEELGDSILKIAPRAGNLALVDYFTPYNQSSLEREDTDLGSGGVLLLPDQPGVHPHMLVQASKAGTIYVLDRDTMTANNLHYCAVCTADSQIVQELPAAIAGGVWGVPVYWNETIYLSGSQDSVRAFSLRQGRLEPKPLSISREHCEYPGCGLSLSANGDHDGILWALDVDDFDFKEPAILRAYDARDLGRLLYASNQQRIRDAPGGALKFIIPTVVSGKVYIGTAGHLTVFGLLRR